MSETEQEQGEEQAEVEEAEKAEAVAEAEKPKQYDEIKILILLKGDSIMLGVQSPDCDPVYTTFKGTLAAALKRAPQLLEEAKKKWDSNPLYPKADLPTPEPRSTPARTPSAPKENKAQPSFF